MRHIPTKAVKAVIRNSNNEVLFLRRHKLREGPTNWDLPGGLVEEGEDEIPALNREIQEEVQKVAVIGKALGKWSFHRPVDDRTVEVQNYEAFLEDENIELSNEHDEAKWFIEADLKSIAVKDPSIFKALY